MNALWKENEELTSKGLSMLDRVSNLAERGILSERSKINYGRELLKFQFATGNGLFGEDALGRVNRQTSLEEYLSAKDRFQSVFNQVSNFLQENGLDNECVPS